MSQHTDNIKTFALAGRLVGDIGECLASYLFDVGLEKKQTEGHDGIYKNVPVEIKVRTASEYNKLNYIHISEHTFKQDFYLIFFVFDTENKEITVEINTLISGNILKEIKINRTKTGCITLNKLKKCLNNKLYVRGIKISDNKLKKISGWKICYNNL
jgi:hypothetical protein